MRIALIAVLLSSLSPALADDGPPDPFMRLFVESCVKNFKSQDELGKRLDLQNVPRLPAGKASFFLGGAKGTAWAMRLGGNPYIVALRDDQVCAVFAQHAAVPEVRRGFESLVSRAPKPLVATRLDDALAGPNNDTLTSTAYSWSKPEDKLQIQFTLTTSSADRANIQAMATMAVTRKNGAAQGK